MSKIWVLVADATNAHIFEMTEDEPSLSEVIGEVPHDLTDLPPKALLERLNRSPPDEVAMSGK